MKLFKLWRDDTEYNEACGFVIRARTESEARSIATQNGGAELGRQPPIYENDGPDVWTNPEKSHCVELTADGEAGVVMRDFYEP